MCFGFDLTAAYKKDPHDKNRLIVDDCVAPIIKDIFNWFLYGIEEPNRKRSSMSMNGIAKELNERGIPCPAAYKKEQGCRYYNPHNKYKDCYWSGTTISRILKDRTYTGCLIQGKFRVISYKIHKQVKTPENEWFVTPNAHEAIMSEEIFEEVQRRLQRDTRTAPGRKEVYLFSGFLQCADCKRALHRRTSKKYVYYYCRTKQASKHACAKHSIRLDVLEKSVLTAIQKQIELAGDLAGIIKKINSAPKLNYQSNRLLSLLKHHEEALARARKISDSLYADWKTGDITREEYQRIKADYSDKIEELEQAVKKIQIDCSVFTSGITSENIYLSEFLEYRNIKSLKRDMLVELIDKIIVHEDREITIKFNFTDQQQDVIDPIEYGVRDPSSLDIHF